MKPLIAHLPSATACDEGRRALLAFVERQARPSLLGIELDGDGRERLPVSQEGRLHDLPGHVTSPLHQLSWPDRHAAGSVDVAQGVLATVASTCVQRYETRAAVNPHRGYPAAHCFFSAQIFLLAEGRAWHLDTAAHGLREVGVHDGEITPTTAVRTSRGAVLAVLLHTGSLPPRYKELRWSLGLLEAGHLTELVVQVARALGLAVRLVRDFVELSVLDAVGARADDGWAPVCLVELGAAQAGKSTSQSATPVAALPAPIDPVLAFERTAWLDECDSTPVDCSAVTVPPDVGSKMTWSDVLFERSAGRGNKGFTASPDPLPRQTLSAVGGAIADALWQRPSISDGGIRTLVVVGRVSEVRPGLYEVDEVGRLRLLATGPDMETIQHAFSYPLTQMSVVSCPAAVVFTVDYRAQLDAGGSRRLRTEQLDLGAAAQAAGLAMTANGGFARPCRSFDPDALASELALAEGEVPAYLALLGVSRFTDLMIDLRA